MLRLVMYESHSAMLDSTFTLKNVVPPCGHAWKFAENARSPGKLRFIAISGRFRLEKFSPAVADGKRHVNGGLLFSKKDESRHPWILSTITMAIAT